MGDMGDGPARDERPPDDALTEARIDALTGEFIRSYMAGLSPQEIAGIYRVDVAAVEEVIATSGARAPERHRWLQLIPFRRGRRRRDGDRGDQKAG